MKTFFFLLLLLCIYTPIMAAENSPLVVHFYFTPTCPLCEPAKQKVAAAEKHFGTRIKVERHNHSASQAAYNGMIAALDFYQRPDTPTLALFVGDVCLSGDEINDNLFPTVEKLLASGVVTPDFAQFLPQNLSSAKIDELAAARVTLPIVLATGFFDGLNPCAFATVILFVSMLASVGRDRRTILTVGLAFIIAVFITYFALGMLFFEIMVYLQNSPTFKYAALAIKWLAWLMVVAAAILSLIDFWRAWRSEGKEKMLLVLPDGLKNRIRKRLRATAHGGSLIVGAFVSGIIVSLLEAACTGQTYMPIITGLVGDNLTARRGYGLLFLYNLMFIIPLVAVFLMAFFGMTSEEIGNVARKKAWVTKLALALVFIAMAVWLGEMLLPTIL